MVTLTVVEKTTFKKYIFINWLCIFECVRVSVRALRVRGRFVGIRSHLSLCLLSTEPWSSRLQSKHPLSLLSGPRNQVSWGRSITEADCIGLTLPVFPDCHQVDVVRRSLLWTLQVVLPFLLVRIAFEGLLWASSDVSGPSVNNFCLEQLQETLLTFTVTFFFRMGNLNITKSCKFLPTSSWKEELIKLGRTWLVGGGPFPTQRSELQSLLPHNNTVFLF